MHLGCTVGVIPYDATSLPLHRRKWLSRRRRNLPCKLTARTSFRTPYGKSTTDPEQLLRWL
jgi:hypothetical protein